jgi:hypothetical protein
MIFFHFYRDGLKLKGLGLETRSWVLSLIGGSFVLGLLRDLTPSETSIHAAERYHTSHHTSPSPSIFLRKKYKYALPTSTPPHSDFVNIKRNRSRHPSTAYRKPGQLLNLKVIFSELVWMLSASLIFTAFALPLPLFFVKVALFRGGGGEGKLFKAWIG